MRILKDFKEFMAELAAISRADPDYWRCIWEPGDPKGRIHLQDKSKLVGVAVCGLILKHPAMSKHGPTATRPYCIQCRSTPKGGKGA